MYLDVLQPKSESENFKSLRILTAILAWVVVITVFLAEFTGWPGRGAERAIVAMMGFWMFCNTLQPIIQRQAPATRVLTFLGLGAVCWLGIFTYFTLQY